MSDSTDRPDAPGGDADPSAPRSPGAAARRARRIGGRPANRPSPSPAGTHRRPAATPPATPPAADPTPAADGAPAPAAPAPATPAPVAPKAEPAAAAPTAEAKTTRITKASKAPKTSKATKRADPKAAKVTGGDDTDAADGPVVVTQVPGWLLWTPAAVLAIVAVVFAVAIAVTAHGVWYAKPSTNSVRDQVLAAAKTCVAATNSYKYTTITQDERNGLKCTTGAWTTNYRKAMEQILIPSSKTLKTVQTTQINAAGVQSVTSHGGTWTLLVFGQASVTSVNQKTPRVDPFSAVVTMRKAHGDWVVADIDQVLKPIKTSGS